MYDKNFWLIIVFAKTAYSKEKHSGFLLYPFMCHDACHHWASCIASSHITQWYLGIRAIRMQLRIVANRACCPRTLQERHEVQCLLKAWNKTYVIVDRTAKASDHPNSRCNDWRFQTRLLLLLGIRSQGASLARNNMNRTSESLLGKESNELRSKSDKSVWGGAHSGVHSWQSSGKRKALP